MLSQTTCLMENIFTNGSKLNKCIVWVAIIAGVFLFFFTKSEKPTAVEK